MASAPLTLSPAAESSLELRSELRRFDGASSLVHELLGAGLAAAEPTVCRCPACSQLFVTSTNVASGVGVAAAALGLDLTFKLHSNPSANHRIYLDFDGYSLASSQWENGRALQVGGFYQGGFTDVTQQAIQDIWRRVAEDFSPFNIDVTTEEPNSEDLKKSGTGDTRWGIRVAMTTNTNLVTQATIFNAGDGGTAYLGSFNWATDEVCFVFNGYNGTDAASIYAAAETVSHEVGHSLGLNHDGGSYGSNSNYYEGDNLTGATGWGSIMGAPFINNDENVTTWSKGDYIGANNKEDDLGIITGSVSNLYVNGNGFTYRVDDYGNSASTAYILSGIAPSSFGIIERSTDIDWFRFSTGSGSISLSIRNACRVFSPNGDGTFSTQYLDALGPNLDISAKIFDASGVLVGSSNPLDRLDASFSLALAAGDYYLSVEGVGFANPLANPPSGFTDYASLGQYLISGTLIEPPPGLIVTPTTGLTTTESAGTASFSVVLATAPTADVSIAIASSNSNEGTPNPSTLTFTNANWNIAQIVTVMGVDDDVVIDGSQTYEMSLTSSSSDSAYQGLSSSVSLTNLDNDLPILSISAPQTVVEGQTTSVTYTVSMSAASPLAASVAYATANGTATAGSDYTASSGSLSFAAGETSKTITINLLNDSLNESDETFSLSLSAPTNATLGSPSSVITTLTDTLVATSSTVLPTGIENLRLDGTAAINGTGNTGANVITGNNGANVLKGGGGIDTLTGLGDRDTFDLSGLSNSANRSTITDFITGSGGETIQLSNSLTSRIGTTPLLALVNQGVRVTLNTTNSDVFSFNFNNNEADVNLANSTNGSALLDGLNAANGSANLSTSSLGGSGYIVAYDNANAYIYRFNAGGNNAVIASEIALIGILDSSNLITVGALTTSNFSLV
ncbi:hypothetical protein KBZ07_13795 [Cyanobium sp. BA20m-14]|nr:hypothetical protein [Cyanobium sp. BA20m-14]